MVLLALIFRWLSYYLQCDVRIHNSSISSVNEPVLQSFSSIRDDASTTSVSHGDDEWTMILITALWHGGLMHLPVCCVVCHLTTRWLVRTRRSRFMRWAVMIVVGDVLLGLWEYGRSGGSEGTGRSVIITPLLGWWSDGFPQQQQQQQQQQPNSPGTAMLWKQWLCLSVMPSLNKNSSFGEMNPPSTVALRVVGQAIHLVFMVLGAYIGQRFVPVALTGSIATGKTTVAKLLLESNNAPSNNDDSMSSPIVHQTLSACSRIRLIDTDSIGHHILLSPARLSDKRQDVHDEITESFAVTATDSVFDRVVAAFGESGVDHKNILNDEGEIDRRKLGDIIFRDHSQRRVLNRITHPRIIRVLLRQIWSGTVLERSGPGIVCADVPLLFESGTLRWLFGIVVVVACQPDAQFRRLCQRNPDLTTQQCRDRMASQMSITKKVSLADIVVWNDGTLDELRHQVSVVRMDLHDRLTGRCIIFRYLCLVGGANLTVEGLGLLYNFYLHFVN